MGNQRRAREKPTNCARDIYWLLRPGGVCINIDMNHPFPVFRSRFSFAKRDPEETYLPTLAEYVGPFELAGFEINEIRNSCWAPHSAGRALTAAACLAAPFLNLVARERAMQSLVVARRPS